MAAASVSETSTSQFSNILAEPSKSDGSVVHHSSSPYVVYPPHKPFLNCDLRRSPNKPTFACLESNSREGSRNCFAVPPHYRLCLGDRPFVAGKSISPSHAVVASVQHVLHLMKQHSKVLCNY
uniref:Uncharacterized protein n=1 Tax=Catagonus wagneri TaxID=51154 RepID=A0A8C3WSK1_9CETA